MLFILLRAALPRPRYDQMMAGWMVCLPVTLLNLLVTGAVVLVRAPMRRTEMVAHNARKTGSVANLRSMWMIFWRLTRKRDDDPIPRSSRCTCRRAIGDASC
jgi:hypothetical protein